ncbi:hypothetical protein [Laspinema palackyanum]|uniref:hypothetical protein n=1 Tax=Laspinema palackyanum TaxID=3231601 RepID=UPI00345DA9E6|nr:hypothetical protein [Laspinema sp. D2c]
MKRQIVVTATVLATLLMNPSLGISQPSPTGEREPGYWQPLATVNVNRPVSLTVVNNTGIPLEYSVRNSQIQRLSDGGQVVLGDYTINPNAQSDRDRNLHVQINPPIEGYSQVLLHFNLESNVRNNNVTVTIRRANAGQRIDRELYFDENGRVYVF